MRFFKFFIIFSILIITYSLKITSKLKLGKDDSVDPNDVPNVNINIEEYDGDPLNFQRFDDERRNLQSKLTYMQMKYESEKKALVKLITHQSSKIEELADLAEETRNRVEVLQGKRNKDDV
jgi:hypothetical protein